MLKNNLVKTNDSEKALELAICINHHRFEMEKTLCEASIASCNKVIANEKGNYSEKKITEAKAKLEILKDELKTLEESIKEAKDVNDKVMSVLCENNSKDAVNNVLNVIASADNAKVRKLAISNVGNEELYNALMECHKLESKNANGITKASKEVKEAYKKIESEVSTLIRDAISLPFETEYTNTLRIKMKSARDLGMIHETFVKGFNIKFSAIKDTDSIEFKELTMSTSISCKSKKDGTKEYNWQAFNKVIADIVLLHLCK